MKKILILFLVTSILYGFLISIIFMDFVAGIIAGLFFGTLMTTIIGILNHIPQRKRKEKNSVRQYEEK